MKKEELHLFEYRIEPKNEGLISIYEHFIAVGTAKNIAGIEEEDYFSYNPNHLKKLPPLKWYSKMEELINDYGYENYRDHLIKTFEPLLKLIRLHSRINALMKKEYKKNRAYVSLRDYIPFDQSTLANSPLHYYFSCSARGVYLKGMILSVSYIPDPLVLKLLLDLIISLPFLQSESHGIPTGLYTYDALEVFSKLEMQKSIPFLLNIKYRKKEKRAQAKIDNYLHLIAQNNSLTKEEIIEIGIPDFDLNERKTLIKEIDDFRVTVDFDNLFKKKILWENRINGQTQKSMPKLLREEHPESIKYIKDQIKEIETQIKIQSKRIEQYYFTNRKWEVDDWKTKYFEHNFMKLLTSNLIWIGHSKSEKVVFYMIDSMFKSINNEPLQFDQFTAISLWHPVGYSNIIIDSVRDIVIKNKLNQPFKQVERAYYDSSSLDSMLGAKMNKSILSQLLKARNWSTASPFNLKLDTIHLEVRMLIEDANDGTRGLYEGSENVCLTELQFYKNEQLIEANLIDEVILSEVIRDVDMFVNVSNKNNDENPQ